MSDPLQPTHLILLAGVAGIGKTTIGQKLAQQLGWSFRDADDFHPPENVAKMSRGEPLTDADRRPWLQALAQAIQQARAQRMSMVLTCSALRRAYRDLLRDAGDASLHIVLLHADPKVIEQRIRERRGHFMKADMLQSQLAALEWPTPDEPGVSVLDAKGTPDQLVSLIRQQLNLQ